MTPRWFQFFYLFTATWGRFPFWPIFHMGWFNHHPNSFYWQKRLNHQPRPPSLWLNYQYIYHPEKHLAIWRWTAWLDMMMQILWNPFFFWNDFKGTIWTMKQNFKSVSWCLRWSENSQRGYSLEEGMLPLSEGNSSRYICCCLRIYLYTCVSILQYWNQNGDWIPLPGRNLDAMTCILTFQKELWRRCAANNLSKSTSFTRFLFAFFFFFGFRTV